MRVFVLGTLLALAASGVVVAQSNPNDAPIPEACRQTGDQPMDMQACADLAAKGSAVRSWALINLGTQAFVRRDFASAVRLYDEAAGPGMTISSDALFHAYRGAAYEHVGRLDEAVADAKTVVAYLDGTSKHLPREARDRLAAITVDKHLAYSLALPILKRGGANEYGSALATYRALPTGEWIEQAQRAAVMEQLGDLEAAVADSTAVLAIQPDHPGVLNNHCYILVSAGRADEGLAYCERASTLVPGDASIQHSLASALAATGQCSRSLERLTEARRLDPSSAAYAKPIPCEAA